MSFLLGAYLIIGVILLIIFLVGVSPIMYNFWGIQDPQMKMVELVNFTKNMALVGALLMFLALPRPWPLSIPLR